LTTLIYGLEEAPPGLIVFVVRCIRWKMMNSAKVTPPQRIVNDA